MCLNWNLGKQGICISFAYVVFVINSSLKCSLQFCYVKGRVMQIVIHLVTVSIILQHVDFLYLFLRIHIILCFVLSSSVVLFNFVLIGCKRTVCFGEQEILTNK